MGPPGIPLRSLHPSQSSATGIRTRWLSLKSSRSLLPAGRPMRGRPHLCPHLASSAVEMLHSGTQGSPQHLHVSLKPRGRLAGRQEEREQLQDRHVPVGKCNVAVASLLGREECKSWGRGARNSAPGIGRLNMAMPQSINICWASGDTQHCPSGGYTPGAGPASGGG